MTFQPSHFPQKNQEILGEETYLNTPPTPGSLKIYSEIAKNHNEFDVVGFIVLEV